VPSPLLGSALGLPPNLKAERHVAEHGEPRQQARFLENDRTFGSDTTERRAVDDYAAAIGGLQSQVGIRTPS
jgi:hypothetical protein